MNRHATQYLENMHIYTIISIGVAGYKNLKNKDCISRFVFANREDPDEMPHYAAFHLGFHCLPKHL